MHIAVFGSSHQDRYLDSLSKLFSTLSRFNVTIEMEQKFYNYLCKMLPQAPKVDNIIPSDGASAEIALSIGGDGTFLRTARRVAQKNIPIVGINTGHLGYLTDATMNEAEMVINDLINKKYQIEERTMLEVTLDNSDTEIGEPYALNEVAILRQDTSSMISVKTSVNGTYFTTYLGDGLIISTPTGSTAYNLSVGGPILDPTSQNVVLSPISPHSLTMRPLVLRDDAVIQVSPQSRSEIFNISIDGRSNPCPIGTSVTIRKAPFTIKVIQSLRHSFVDTLRDKLMWGADIR